MWCESDLEQSEVNKWSIGGKQVKYVMNHINYELFKNSYMSIWNTNSNKKKIPKHREAIKSRISGIIIPTQTI